MTGEEKATTLPTFNPSGDERVSYIKDTIENLIGYIRQLDGNPRCIARSLDKLEEASMWAVKSLFVK